MHCGPELLGSRHPPASVSWVAGITGMHFYTTKETISKMKGQSSEWEKIIANETTDKELIPKIYKQLTQLNTRKTNNQSKNGQKLRFLFVCFNFLAIENIAALKTEVQIYLWHNVFVSFRYIPRSGVTGSSGIYIYIFFFFLIFWGNFIFSLVFVPVYNPTNSARIFFSPQPHQCLLSHIFLMIVHGNF